MDNIFILNHIVHTAKVKKEKIYALSIDFHTDNRSKLWEILEKFGISRSLIQKIKGIYEETKCLVKI